MFAELKKNTASCSVKLNKVNMSSLSQSFSKAMAILIRSYFTDAVIGAAYDYFDFRRQRSKMKTAS